MIKKIESSTAVALLAAASFALGLWTLVRPEFPVRPGEDVNVHFDITPVSVGFLLAGIALIFLRGHLRRRAVTRAATATKENDDIRRIP